MKKNKRYSAVAIELNQTPQLPYAKEQLYSSPSNQVFLLYWLAGAVLFFLFNNLAIPYLLGSIDPYDAAEGLTGNNLFFGICGLFIYLIEPLVHYSFNGQEQNVNDSKKPTVFEKRLPNVNTDNIFLLGIKFLLSAVFFLFAMPYMILVWLRPVFRALILLESFSLLNLGGGESRLFVIIVMTDILLYYLNLFFPNWKHSPGRMIARFAWFNQPVVYSICQFLSIVYTAIICTAFATGSYLQTASIHDKAEQLIILIWFWYLLMLYVRMNYLGKNIDNLYEAIKTMPRRNLLLNILTLVISFVAFMWRYFWG